MNTTSDVIRLSITVPQSLVNDLKSEVNNLSKYITKAILTNGASSLWDNPVLCKLINRSFQETLWIWWANIFVIVSVRADRVIPKVEIRTHEDTKILERDIFVSPESIIILDPELAPLVTKYVRFTCLATILTAVTIACGGKYVAPQKGRAQVGAITLRWMRVPSANVASTFPMAVYHLQIGSMSRHAYRYTCLGIHWLTRG